MAGAFDEWDAKYGGVGKRKQKDAFSEWDAKYGVNQPDPRDFPISAEEAPTAKENGFLREVADTGLSIGKGLVGAGQSITNLFGADNAVSRGLDTTRKYLGTLESDEQRAQRQAHSARMKSAEDTGSFTEEVKAAWQNFKEDPLDYAAEGLGSAAVAAPVRLISAGAKVAGVGARTAALAGIGGAQGVGAVKGAQYDAMREAKLADGYSEEQARELASEAQAYSRENAVDLLTGLGLGVAAGTTGADRVLGGAAGKAGRGLVKRAAVNTLAEGSMEGLQGGQERYAANQALIRDGYEINPWKGVAGNATTEALMSAPVGAATGALEGYTPTEAEIAEQQARQAEYQRQERDAALAAQQQAEAQQAAEKAKAERDAARAYYAEQLPFETFKKQRVEEITNEQITPEVIEAAYQEAFKDAVAQEIAPPDRAKFEKQYKNQVKKEIAKSTDELTQEYYETLDNMAATGVDLLGDPTELNVSDEAEPDSPADAAAEPQVNRRQMDFLGELDRTVQPDYSPVMPVATPGEGTPATTVFTQTPVDDSGLPGALQEAKARAAKGGAVDTPPNADLAVPRNPLMAARDAALKNGVSKGSWAKFVSSRNLIDADTDTVAEAIRDRAINGSGSNNPAWEAAHTAVTGISIDDYLAKQEQQNEGVQAQTGDEKTAIQNPAESAATALAKAQVSTPAVVVPELATQQKRVYDVLVAAAQEGDLDDYIAADGTINYQRIADKMGIPRQSAKAAIDQTVKRFERANGGTLREKLANRTKAVRTTEAADEDMLGTSPANFTKGSLQVGAKLDNSDLFGDDAGADQSFGVVETVGGSQSAVGENELAPVDDKPDPVTERRQAEALERNAAFQREALSRPEAAEAAADWDDMRSSHAPLAKDLSRQDAYEWLMSYMEWKHGDITEETLAADQLDIERRYDADPDKAAGVLPGAGETATAKPALAEGDRKAETPVGPDAEKTAGDASEDAQGLDVEALTGLLTQLRGLGKDPKHAAIAKDFLTRALNGEDVQAEAGAWVNAVNADKRGEVMFSRDNDGERPGMAVDKVARFLKALFNSPTFFTRHVNVVQGVEDVSIGTLSQMELSDDDVIKGFYDPTTKRVTLIAENLTSEREALAVFLHEVGVHMGMKNLLGPANYDALVNQIKQWAETGKGVEGDLARRALDRIEAAEVAGDTRYDPETHNDELIAYFVEEAVNDGIDPTALSSKPGSLQQWFRTLWAAAKAALHKLGIRPDSLTAQNLVDLAYGAARMEMNGTWHGTAAEFRKFDHKFMGSGEGAQAFGWGSYLAQKGGIAYGYWKNDVRRKGTGGPRNTFWYDGEKLDQVLPDNTDATHIAKMITAVYGEGMVVGRGALTIIDLYGVDADVAEAAARIAKTLDVAKGRMTQETATKGAVMRVDVAVAEDEWLDWDKPLSEQSDKVRTALSENMDAIVGIHPANKLSDWDDSAGRELYELLSQTRGSDKAASLYLDSIGIKGIRFLDGDSRNADTKIVDKQGKLATLYGKNARDTASFANGFESIDAAISEARVQAAQYPSQVMSNIVEDLTRWKASGYKIVPADKTYNLVVFDDKNIQRVYSSPGAKADARKFSVGRKKVDEMIDDLPKHLGEPARWMNTNFGELSKGAKNLIGFTDQLVDSAKSVLPTAKAWFEAMKTRETVRIRNEERVDQIAREVDKLSQADFNRTWTLLRDMTRSKKWGYAPNWKPDAVVDAEMASRYRALSAPEKAVIDAVLKHGHDTLLETNAQLTTIANDLFDEKIARTRDPVKKKQLTEDKAQYLRVYGRKLLVPSDPYAPMRRVGTHATVGKSQLYLDTEAKAKAGDKKAIKQLDELRADDRHHLVAFSDNLYEAERIAREYRAAGLIATASVKEVFTSDDQLPFQSFQTLREMANEKDGDHAVKLMNMIDELYLESLSDVSARKSELRRTGVGGLSADSMYKAFLAHGKSSAHYMSVLKTHRDVAGKFAEMRTQAHEPGGDRHARMSVFNEMKKRFDASFNYEPAPLINKMMGASTYWMLLTKPAYYLYNLTQPLMMTLPYMTKRHDYTAAANQMVRAYSDLMKLPKAVSFEHFDLRALPADIRDAIIELRDMGRIDITITQDLGKRVHAGTGKASKYVARMDGFFRSMAQKTEMANRIVTAASAFRLHMAKNPGDRAGAMEYAAEVVDRTQGDYSNFNAPRLFNMNNTARLMTQFRKFQLIQASLLVSMVKGIKDPHERAVNSRALMFTLGHHAIFAGAMGLPAMNLIAMAFAASGDDEEPRDLELWMKNNLGDDEIGKVLRYGLPSLFNVNMSSNIGMGQTFSVIPYADVDATRSGYDSVITSLAGPTIGGLLPQFWAAGAKGLEGDYYGFLNGLMPGFVKTGMKAVRESSEGVKTGSGDVVVSAEEITMADTLMKSLGFKTVNDTTRQLVTGKRYEFEAFFRDKTRDIKKDYNDAYREGDGTRLEELRESWMDLQSFKRDYGFKAQGMSDLLKAPIEQAKRERNTISGVQFDDGNRGFVDEYASEEATE